MTGHKSASLEVSTTMSFGKVSAMSSFNSVTDSPSCREVRSPSTPRPKASTWPHDLGAARGALSMVWTMLSRWSSGRSRRSSRRRHHDRRKDVVQVVSHAAGERADALHALRTQHLRLEFFDR